MRTLGSDQLNYLAAPTSRPSASRTWAATPPRQRPAWRRPSIAIRFAWRLPRSSRRSARPRRNGLHAPYTPPAARTRTGGPPLQVLCQTGQPPHRVTPPQPTQREFRQAPPPLAQQHVGWPRKARPRRTPSRRRGRAKNGNDALGRDTAGGGPLIPISTLTSAVETLTKSAVI